MFPDPAKNPALFLAVMPIFTVSAVATLQLYGSFFDRIRLWVDPAKVHDTLLKGDKP